MIIVISANKGVAQRLHGDRARRADVAEHDRKHDCDQHLHPQRTIEGLLLRDGGAGVLVADTALLVGAK